MIRREDINCFTTVQYGREVHANHTGETPVPHILKQLLRGTWLIALAIGANAALAQVPGPATTPATQPAIPKAGIVVATTEPDYAHARRVPDDLLEGPRRQVIILPREPSEVGDTGEPAADAVDRSGGVVAKVPAEAHRLPEGYVIGSRPGSVERQGKWMIAHLARREGMPDSPPLRILPNMQLAMLEAILAEVPGSSEFLLTGRITEFQGVDYLLLEHLAQSLPPPLTEAAESAKPAASLPAAVSGKSPAGGEPSPEEIVRQLMKTEPQRALVLPSRPADKSQTASSPAAAESAGQEPTGWPEGTFLIDRAGRVVPAGDDWWSLAWEDRGEQARQKPVRLLPNRLLESALALSGSGMRGVVFIVSGEVTEYKGTNYFLLRKVLLRRDLGNLR